MRPDADGVMRSVRIPEHIDVVGDLACGAQLHIQVSNVSQDWQARRRCISSGATGLYVFQGNKLYGGQKGDAELNEIDIPDCRNRRMASGRRIRERDPWRMK